LRNEWTDISFIFIIQFFSRYVMVRINNIGIVDQEIDMKNMRTRIIIGQILIGGVMLFNIQCALLFLTAPDRFLNSFELVGTPGMVMVQGLGMLFLMWNVPYGFALWNPVGNRVSLYEALAMQSIGLVGETTLLMNMAEGHTDLINTGLRFILFDAVGLVCLGIALALTIAGKRGIQKKNTSDWV
jgi:hypothetical protein